MKTPTLTLPQRERELSSLLRVVRGEVYGIMCRVGFVLCLLGVKQDVMRDA
jgi:hypothetical protein